MIERIIYYHYTNINACQSIIQNKTLWMSDCRFLNDAKELKDAKKKFLQLFNGDDFTILQKVLFYCSDLRHHCVLSLSRSPRVLSQWRAYSEDGTGVALGFDKYALEYDGITLEECIYTNHSSFIETIKSEYGSDIKNIIKENKGFLNSHMKTDWLELNPQCMDKIIQKLLLVKNSAFKEEQEIRAIKSFSSKEISFRVSSNIIIPYKSISLAIKDGTFITIPEIWLGPKSNPLNEISLKTIPLVTIEKYDCGYR